MANSTGDLFRAEQEVVSNQMYYSANGRQNTKRLNVRKFEKFPVLREYQGKGPAALGLTDDTSSTQLDAGYLAPIYYNET